MRLSLFAVIFVNLSLPPIGAAPIDAKDNGEVAKQFAQAESAAQQGKTSEAIRLFTLISKTAPDSTFAPKSYFNISVLKRKEGRLDEAISQFKELIAKKPNDTEPGGNLETAYRNYTHRSAVQIADILEDQGKFKEALEYAEMAITKHRYLSWCGTCAGAEAGAGNARIKWLKALIYRSAHTPASAE